MATVRRAKKGSIATKLLIPIDAELEMELKAATAMLGISTAELIRSAIREALDRLRI